jgi:hypothetical protein
MTASEILVMLAGIALGVSFVIKPRWWARLRGIRTPWSERVVATQTVFFFVVGLGVLVLMVVVLVTRAT